MTARSLAVVFALLVVPVASSADPSSDTDPLEPAETGHHLLTFFSIKNPSGQPTVTLAAVDADGHLIFEGRVASDRLHVSDGMDAGVERPSLTVPRPMGTSFHRVDVLLNGDTYTITLDQQVEATARTFVHATEGAWVDDPRPLGPTPGEDVRWAMSRVDPGDGSLEEAFTRPLSESAWVPVVTGGSIEHTPGTTGHYSRGDVEIVSGLSQSVTYLTTDVSEFNGRFGADASAGSKINILFEPSRQAVLAGLSGPLEDPVVHWAFVLDRAFPDADTYALHYQAPDGSREQVGPLWWRAHWQSYRFTVDEGTDTIAMSLNEGDPLTFSGHDLGTVDRVAVGDVFAGLDGQALTSEGMYDDIAVYPLASGVAP